MEIGGLVLAANTYARKQPTLSLLSLLSFMLLEIGNLGTRLTFSLCTWRGQWVMPRPREERRGEERRGRKTTRKKQQNSHHSTISALVTTSNTKHATPGEEEEEEKSLHSTPLHTLHHCGWTISMEIVNASHHFNCALGWNSCGSKILIFFLIPTLDGVGHQWTTPTSRGHFRAILASESHWLHWYSPFTDGQQQQVWEGY